MGVICVSVWAAVRRSAAGAGLLLLPAVVYAQGSNILAPQRAPLGRASTATWRTFKFGLLDSPFKATYSRDGLNVESPRGAYTAHIQWRLQPRFSFPFDDDPRRASQFATDDEHVAMRRARYKMDGKVLGGFVTYKFEQDLVGGQMIDLYADVNFKPWLRVRFGQWKSVFTQERYISSGRQQFVERSIVNREFTLDRQAGVSLFGRFAKGTLGDSMYNLEVLNGTGMNSGLSGDGSPLLVGRYQWNFLGEDPGYSSSDTGNRRTPAAYVAVTGARNTSAFTRYSSSGGGQLDGFTSGDSGRYRLTQVNGELLLKYRGMSIQNENHWKAVLDRTNQSRRTLRGSYLQGGYFLHNVLPWMPSGVEIAYRYAVVDPDTGAVRDLRREHSLAVNVFLEGHDNKWTIDVSRLSVDRAGPGPASGFRYRVQYDVQF